MSTICIAENVGGFGGIAGKGGAEGQPSLNGDGAMAVSYGWPVIETVTGLTRTFDIQLTKDATGTIPADLTNIGRVMFSASANLRDSRYPAFEKACSFTNDGKVTLELTPKEVDFRNGMWYGSFLTYDKDTDALVGDYRAFLCIRKGTKGSKSGPHTITPMDVRLALFDVSPESNDLLDDLEFSDMQIINAVERCVDEWNETPPRLARAYDATNFPWREHLVKGAVGFLMQTAAYRYTRNRMQYSAAGLSTDTNDKGPQYIQLAQMARLEWKNFIAASKTEANMEEAFGTFDLPYFG